MEILGVKNKEFWNGFLAEQKLAQFCQSFEWGEFQQSLGRKIFRLSVLEGGEILAVCLLIKNRLPFNKSYFYSPRGPILSKSKVKNEKIKIIIDSLIKKIKELAKQEGAIFWRFEVLSKEVLSDVFDSGFKVVNVQSVQPSKTLILDLTKPEERLLAEMHPKTRYNIKLAERMGVKIGYINNSEDVKNFLFLLQETALRDRFKPHPDFYYQKMFEILGRKEIGLKIQGISYLSCELYKQGFLRLIKAEFRGKILAANILIYFGDTVTYVHGASSSERKNLMAPLFLQWQAILDAKELGYRYYDFWGINEKKWPGVTRFKNSFGGQTVEYPGTFDLPLNKKWYSLYSLAKKFLQFIFYS